MQPISLDEARLDRALLQGFDETWPKIADRPRRPSARRLGVAVLVAVLVAAAVGPPLRAAAGDGGPLLGLGWYLHWEGRPAAAARVFQVARWLQPTDVAPRLGSAEALLSLGRPSEAGRQFAAALGADPTNARAIVGLAESLEEAGQSEAALTYWLEASRIEDQSVVLWVRIQREVAAGYLRRGDCPRAVPYLSRLLKHRDTARWARWSLLECRAAG